MSNEKQELGRKIRERFNTQWATFSPTYDLYFSGIAVPQSVINGDNPWVRLTINWGDTVQVGIQSAGRRKRTIGVAQVQIFVPINTGDGLGIELADRVADVWEMSTIETVIFRATSIQRVGEEGAWLQFNANTPFQGDTLVTS